MIDEKKIEETAHEYSWFKLSVNQELSRKASTGS